jgi:hypothetical protein
MAYAPTIDDEAAEVAARYLAEGRERRAFEALGLGIRGRSDLGRPTHATLADCVAAQPRRIGRALALACSAGSDRDRILLAGTVFAAILRSLLPRLH